jgi:hypothetical protein
MQEPFAVLADVTSFSTIGPKLLGFGQRGGDLLVLDQRAQPYWRTSPFCERSCGSACRPAFK